MGCEYPLVKSVINVSIYYRFALTNKLTPRGFVSVSAIMNSVGQ